VRTAIEELVRVTLSAAARSRWGRRSLSFLEPMCDLVGGRCAGVVHPREALKLLKVARQVASESTLCIRINASVLGASSFQSKHKTCGAHRDVDVCSSTRARIDHRRSFGSFARRRSVVMFESSLRASIRLRITVAEPSGGRCF